MTKHRVIETGLGLLALAPLVAAAVTAIRVWAFGAPVELWTAPSWVLYLLQVFALAGFAAHVLGNGRLGKDESGSWITQILLFQQVVMVRYWVNQVWGQSPGVPPDNPPGRPGTGRP